MIAGGMNMNLTNMNFPNQFLGHSIPGIDSRGLRKFGLMFAGIFVVLFGLLIPLIFDYEYRLWPWLVAGVFTILGLLVANSLYPFYHLWMRFGVIMNVIMSKVILGSVFLLTIIPAGCIFKIRRKDILGIALDQSLKSYRTESDNPDSDHLKKPY